MRILVTGADGFVARHLIPLLQRRGDDVVGTVLTSDHAAGLGVSLERLDITDAAICRDVLRRVAPNRVIHLAAASSVRWSFEHPDETRRINVEGTLNVLEAAQQVGVERALVVGSSEEYGVNRDTPVSELPVEELRPLSPYAESKVQVERFIESLPELRAFTIRTRSFPHIGPGQRTGFFTADVAAQLVHIAAGDAPPVLQVGNVDTIRDYTDVRDTVRAYALLLDRGVPGETYNVAAGRPVSLRDIMEQLIALAGVTVRVEQNSEKVRLLETPVNLGNNTKLRSATGWEPEIVLSQTVADILAWWREEVRLSKMVVAR